MAIKYRVYRSPWAGGPVDYSAPVADLSATAWAAPTVPVDSDVTFAVRAYDDVSGLEERNLAARFRLVTGPAGEDLTRRPRAPRGLAARPGLTGSVELDWHAAPAGSGAAPTAFRVYAGTPAVDYSSPALTVPADLMAEAYRAAVTGLTGGAPYRFAVRAVAGSLEEPNTAEVACTPPAGFPAAPQAAGAAAVTGDPK